MLSRTDFHRSNRTFNFSLKKTSGKIILYPQILRTAIRRNVRSQLSFKIFTVLKVKSMLLAGTKEETKTVPLDPLCNFRMQRMSYLEEPRKCKRKHKLSCSFMCLTNINQPNIAIQQMLPSMLERYCVFHWPTNAFFATVNQMFGGSFDFPASGIHCFVVWTVLNDLITAQHLIDGSGKKTHLSVEVPNLLVRVRMLLKGAVNRSLNIG